MHDLQRHRSNASECLLASFKASQPFYGELNFSMAALWLAIAGPDEAMDNLLLSWGIAEPIETDGLVRFAPRASHSTSTTFVEPLRQRPYPTGRLSRSGSC